MTCLSGSVISKLSNNYGGKGCCYEQPLSIVKYMVLLSQIVILFVFYYVGMFLQDFFQIPIPGSIIGPLLLFLCLQIKLIPVNYINRGAGSLIAILPLLFVPVCIGVMKYPVLLSVKGFNLMFIVFISTLFTMLVAGLTSQLLHKSTTKRKDQRKWEKY